MYGAPIAFAIIFILLLIICPFIFKPIFKIDSFFGYCQGVCCSVLTAITIVVAAIIGIIVFVSKASDVGGNADDALEAVGSGLLFLIFIVIVAAYFGVVFFLFAIQKESLSLSIIIIVFLCLYLDIMPCLLDFILFY